MIKEIKDKYGLLHIPTNEIVGYSMQYHDDGDGDNEQYQLVLESKHGSGIEVWYLDDPNFVEWVRTHHTEYYDADHHTPMNYFDAKDLQVIKINVPIIIETVEVNLPTVKEVYTEIYGKKNKRHLKSLEKDIESGKIKLAYCRLLEYYALQKKK